MLILILALLLTTVESEPLTRVPFESPHDLIVLTVIVEGEPLRMLLDSGASHSLVDTGVADRLGLETGRSRTRRSTSENSSATTAPLPGGLSFTLESGFELQLDRAVVGPFSEAGRVLMGMDAHGVIGNEFFERFTVEVDYAARTLSLFDPASYAYEGEGAELPLTFPVAGLPFTSATFENGDQTVRDTILVDSGGMTMGTASLSLASDWESLVTDGRVIEQRGATGISDDPEGATHAVSITRMDRFRLGPFGFEEPVISHSTGGPRFGIFGATTLHRFTAVFDYARDRLILEPNARLADPFLNDWSGALFVANGDDPSDIHVMQVIDGMPAARAGLQRGDEVLSINGVDADRISIEQVRRMMAAQGQFALAVRRDDETLELEFETTSPW